MAVSNSTDRFNGVLASKAIKVPCKVATSANITLNGAQTINGVPVVSGDRVLVAAQTNSIENGIYIVDSSEWQRAADWDGSRDVTQGTLISALDSGGNLSQYVLSTPDPITIGTTPVTIDLYSTGASGIVPPSTQESSLLRADALGGWQEESLVRATDTGELRVYEPAGTDFLQFDYVGTSLLATLDNPTHTIEFGNDIVIQGSDLILDSGDIILGGGTISGAGWLLPWETPIQWEDDTTPTPVITDFLVFAGFTPGGEPAPDPNLGNVTLLVTGETTPNFTTSFSADIGGVSWTYTNGDPFSGAELGYVTGTNFKNGAFSIFCKGETGATFEGFVGPAQNSLEAAVFFPIGLEEFTIEFWLDPSTEYTGLNPDGRWGNNYPVISSYNDQNAGAQSIEIDVEPRGWFNFIVPISTGRLTVLAQVDHGQGYTNLNWQNESWHHFALTRESDGEFRAYFDGVFRARTGLGLQPSQATLPLVQPSNNQTVNFGCRQRNGQLPNGQGAAAYTDDLRITKGVARYIQGAANVGDPVFTPPGPMEGTAKTKQFVVGDPTYQVNLNAPSVLFDDGTNSSTITPNSVGLTLGADGMSAGQFAVQDGVGNSRIVWSNTAGDDSISAEADGARLHFKNQTGLFTSVRFGEDPFPVNVDVSGGDLIISGYVAGANEAKRLSFQDSGGVEYAYLETTATGALQIGNISNDDNVAIIGNDGGSLVEILSWNPASHLNLRAPGGRDLNLYVATTLAQKIDNLGNIDFYYLGDNVARVSSQAAGGFLVAQTDTGDAGTFSRVQTQYDLGSDQEFWFWDFSTFMSDPTQSRFRLDNADVTLATNIAVDDLTISERDFGGSLAAIQAGTQIRMVQTTDLTLWAVYEATGPATDNTGWWQIPVTYVAHNGTFPGASRPPFKLTFSNLLSNPAGSGLPDPATLGDIVYYDGADWVVGTGTGNNVARILPDGDPGGIYLADVGPELRFLYDDAAGITWDHAGSGRAASIYVDDSAQLMRFDSTYTKVFNNAATRFEGTSTYFAYQSNSFNLEAGQFGSDMGIISGNTAQHLYLNAGNGLYGIRCVAPIFLTEGATPRPNYTSLGQLWMRNSNPQLPGFINGDGDDYALITMSNMVQAQFTTATTATLPGDGYFKFNNATMSSVTNMYIDDDLRNGSWDPVEFGWLKSGDIITMKNMSTGTSSIVASVTGTPTDNTGWWTVPISILQGVTQPATNDVFELTIQHVSRSAEAPQIITAGWRTSSGGSGGSLTIEANAPLFLEEQAADDNPGAGQGQVWLRNDTPNTLMFTDDAGTDFVIGGAAVPSGITGTVADNQIVVGTGASSVDSSSELTYDATTGQLIHTHATTSLFQTGITAGVHTQITTQDNFAEIQFSDDSVDTSVARILFNINSASTGVHEYWFRDNDGTYMTIDCTNQQLTFAGRLGLIAQNDHGATFSSGEGQIWAKSRSQGDDLMFTADDYREDISLLSVMTHCYVFDNATAAADPGAGEFRLNNATPASVTQVYVNDADDGGRDAAYMLANLDVGDVITFRQSNNTAHYFTAQVSATPTDNTGWWTIPVTPIHTGTLFSLGNPSHLEVQWLSRVSTLTTDLDVNGNDIVSNVTNGNIYLIPNGTGVVAVRSGKTLRVYDGDNSDYIQMWHDGTNGRITALGGVINLVNETLLEPLLQDYSIENVSYTPTGTTQTLTYSDGPAFEVDLESVTGNITITLAGAPPSGNYGQMVVKVTQDSATARTITWAGGTFRWPGGTAHPMNSTLNGFSIYTFETWDGGTTWWATGADYS